MSFDFSDLFTVRKHYQRSCLATVMALVLLIYAPAPAHALSVVPRAFDDLVHLADLVVVGTVDEIHSEFADAGLDQNTIFSYVSLGDLEVVKGQIDTAPYVLRVPGGVVGRHAQEYAGIPMFQTGQRYLVFIRGNQHDFFPVVGITQGVFRILSNAQGQQVVIRDDRLNHAGLRALTAATQNAPTLAAFLDNIRSRLTPAAPAAGGNLP
jgi:hypothetical protein